MEGKGFFVVKLIKTNKNGIPDLLCMRKDEYFFIEVKSSKGKLSKIQEYRIKELQTFERRKSRSALARWAKSP